MPSIASEHSEIRSLELRYRIYHAKNHYFLEFYQAFGQAPVALQRIDQTHVYLHDFEASSLGDLWNRLQRAEWQPDAQQAALILAHATHTTFSGGDIAEDEQGHFWQCMGQGWHLLESNRETGEQ